MPDRAYLDWNATTPLAPGVKEAILQALDATTRAGRNPSSQHQEGRQARAILEKARRTIASAAGASADNCVLLSGATEAANMVMRLGWDRIILSAVEHDCVRAAAALSTAERQLINVDPSGTLNLASLDAALSNAPERTLVAVMAVNNETGALHPVSEVVERAKRAGAATFIDAVQAFGKTAFDFTAIGADFAALSAHKIGGPTGVGALLVRPGLSAQPLLVGGGQEQRRRASTENIIGAVGFAAAVEKIDLAEWAEIGFLRDQMEERLNAARKDLVFFAQHIDRVAGTSCFAAPGWRAETQLMQLDLAGFAVSAGSACSSGKLAPSHVLQAMGATEELAACAIRVSFGSVIGAETLEAFTDAYIRLSERARRAS